MSKKKGYVITDKEIDLLEECFCELQMNYAGMDETFEKDLTIAQVGFEIGQIRVKTKIIHDEIKRLVLELRTQR
jgi:hypothetical protein